MLTVSTVLDGEYGLHDACLSVPCLVAEGDMVRIVEVNLPPAEMEALARSAAVLRDAISALA